MAGLDSVELRDVSKRFGQVVALAEASLTLRGPEVHVLAGENGSGKTTLMNVLSGLYRPDTGSIVINGGMVAFRSPRDALHLGIGMVHQHFELVGPFTALENVLLGHEGGGMRLHIPDRRHDVDSLMTRYGLTVDLAARVNDVSIGVQQKIEILKALYRGVELLILDEPTTHLTPQEVDGLFATIRQLVRGGLTVVLITHKLREIRDIADRVTVLRTGHVVATVDRQDASDERLVELLMGRRGAPPQPAAASAPGATGTSLLRLDHVSASRLLECSLELRANEIVGIAGVAGNGQRELAEAIIGTRPIVSGTLSVRDWNATHADVRDRILLGLGYVPEDRLREGILPRQSLAETFALGLHHTLFQHHRLFDEARVRQLTRAAIDEYRVVAPSERVATARLSGGNLQKVLVARAIRVAKSHDPPLLLAMNPTRGLDMATTALVHQQLDGLRSAGGAVLLVSEDLDELMRLSDRILVMYRGRITGEFLRSHFDPYQLGSVMAGASLGV